jgi:hypothetical protein
MLPAEVAGAVDGFLAALERVAPGQVAAVYGAGALALDDFSHRQSNVDLVVVCDPAADRAQIEQLGRAERGLNRAGRAPGVWYTTWEEVAGDPVPEPGVPEPGVPEPGRSKLSTPMTRALLRSDPMALIGPDWPVVGFDDAEFRSWCRTRLQQMASGRKGLLVLRRAVTPLVLEAARLAQGAVTGRLFSKTEAGESVGPLVSTRYRRILTDAVGYRRGAQTSMYWGPFERKYDALVLLRDLAELAGE